MRRFTEETRRRLVEEFHGRKIKAEKFAQEHGVGVSTLYQWSKRPKRPKATRIREPQFQEVSLARAGAWAGEVCLPDGTQVRWNGSAGLAGAERLIHELRRRC